MTNTDNDHTDETSIKPVSSLRSHFESIAVSESGSNYAPSRERQPRLQLPETHPLESSRRLSSSVSLDRANDRAFQAAHNAGLREEAHGGLRPPAPSIHRGLSPPESPPRRPTSAGALSPSHKSRPAAPKRPLSRIQSHTSKQNVGSNDQTAERDFSASSAPATVSSPQSPGRHLKAPNHAGTFHSERSTSDSSSLSDSKRKSSYMSGSETNERFANLRSPVPPPVNRAEKPSFLSTPTSGYPEARAKKSSDLTPSPRPLERVASPFSTPSSRSDSSNTNDSLLSSRQESLKSTTANNRGSVQVTGSEPPSVRHVTQRVRDSRNTAYADSIHSQTGPESEVSARRNVPRTEIRIPPRDTASGIDTRYQKEADSQTLSPMQSNPTVPGATAFRGAAVNVKFPPPPKRSNTLGFSDGDPNQYSTFPVGEQGHGSLLRQVNSSSPPSIPKNRRSHENLQELESSRSSATISASNFPDSSFANRRRPRFENGAHDIHTKQDTRLFAVCGQYVCCTGHLTRVWNVTDGQLIMGLSHGENVKITSLAFKTATALEEEGNWLWLGTSHGEIQEVDIRNQNVSYVKTSAHPRREVIKIYRHGNEMWTLDDEGKLHVWPPDESGSPNLMYSHQSYRVPKGHSFSLVVGDELWIATGKDIRVFHPSSDPDVQFQVLAKPLSQTGTGEVTSGAVMGSRYRKVFFGHTDGKVTIYACEDYACLGIVNVSLYKINSLSGFGDCLWAGFNTGKIYVYDTRTVPWKVKKDWLAHDNPVIDICLDTSSVWQLDRLQFASLGTDNCVRLWDALLRDDWLESEMHEHDVEYCDFRELTALVMTWNVGASTPQSLRYDENNRTFLKDLLRNQTPPELLIFAFQELVDLEDKKVTAKSFFKSSKKKDSSDQEHMSRQYRAWRDHLTECIEEYMPADKPYYLLQTATLVGLFTCIFAKVSEQQRIRSVDAAEVKRGMGGLHGNKGALVVRLILDDSSICLINCHLAAGQSQTMHRNNDIATILETTVFPGERNPSRRIDLYVGGGDGTMILDHEICILNGDLNYRIDTMSRETVINAVKANNLAKLLERDQLLLSRRKNPGFRLRAFNEAPITFAPTYKYDVGTDTYDTSDKKRAPAWCDRLLYRGMGRIKQVDYRRHEVRVSDHRPVSGLFKIRVKTISPTKRTMAWARCEEAFEALKFKLLTEIKHDFLVSIYGFNPDEAARVLHSPMKR